MLNQLIQELEAIFSATADRYEAHKKARPVMKKMVANRTVLHEIIKKNLSNPDFFNKNRHYPTLAFNITENDNFSLVTNCFMPLPDKSVQKSFQSIHHHGDLLLTTAAAFGVGYESILFKKGFEIDTSTKETKMGIDRIYQFAENDVEFVDANTPHIVFFPTDLSMTYALWSYDKPKKVQALKKVGLLRGLVKPVKYVVNKLGLHALLGLNKVEYFDFYPDNGKLIAMQERISFEEGSNDNFLQNVFYILQKTGFNDLAYLKHLRTTAVEMEQKNLIKWIDKYLAKEPIVDEFLSFHANVGKVNLDKSAILAAVQ